MAGPSGATPAQAAEAAAVWEAAARRSGEDRVEGGRRKAALLFILYSAVWFLNDSIGTKQYVNIIHMNGHSDPLLNRQLFNKI